MDFCEWYVVIANMRNWSHSVASAEVFALAVVLEEWLKAQRF
jgi:hypothetical protein